MFEKLKVGEGRGKFKQLFKMAISKYLEQMHFLFLNKRFTFSVENFIYLNE